MLGGRSSASPGKPPGRTGKLTATSVTGPHRLVAQDTALSRRRHGFESRWGHRGPSPSLPGLISGGLADQLGRGRPQPRFTRRVAGDRLDLAFGILDYE